MPQRKGPRLDGRNGQIWRRYLEGWTQERIAAELTITQTCVSQIIKEVRESIPEHTKAELVTTSDLASVRWTVSDLG